MQWRLWSVLLWWCKWLEMNMYAQDNGGRELFVWHRLVQEWSQRKQICVLEWQLLIGSDLLMALQVSAPFAFHCWHHPLLAFDSIAIHECVITWERCKAGMKGRVKGVVNVTLLGYLLCVSSSIFPKHITKITKSKQIYICKWEVGWAWHHPPVAVTQDDSLHSHRSSTMLVDGLASTAYRPWQEARLCKLWLAPLSWFSKRV